MSEENSIYVAPSFVTGFFKQHMEAMKHCNECPEDRSFALGKEGLELGCLQQIAESLSVGKKCFVVIEHDTAFEVYRAADGTPRHLLRKYSGQAAPVEANATGPQQAIINLLRQYLDAELADIRKYDNATTLQQKLQGEISQMYLQRRLLSTAAFKKGGRANEKFKEAIAALVEAGLLVKLEDEESSKAMFKINKDKLNAN